MTEGGPFKATTYAVVLDLTSIVVSMDVVDFEADGDSQEKSL